MCQTLSMKYCMYMNYTAKISLIKSLLAVFEHSMCYFLKTSENMADGKFQNAPIGTESGKNYS